MKRFLLLAPALLLSQTITNIQYKGLIHLSPETANTLIKITPNSELNLKKIDESIKALYKTGYFKTIKADINNNTLTFICVEKPTISKIEMEHLSNELKKILKEQNMLPKKGEILNKDKLKQLKNFIENYYLAKGYFNTVVQTDIIPISATKIILKITIKKGNEITIRKVNFFGATISKSDLEDEIENREKTFWSFLPFVNSGKLKIFKLVEDRNNLQDFYMNLGYLDSKVSIPLAKPNLDSYFADIDYKIYEGPRYIVKKISVDYPKNIKVKLPKFELKPNKYFNISALRKDIENIKHAFQNLGYAYAKVYPSIKKEKNNAFITYIVEPGNIYYINNVVISGNTKTLDRVIRRNIYLAPGEKFSYQNLVDSKNALQRTGYLEDVKITQKRISNNKMDILVKVKEGLSGSLRAGISYGSYTKLGLTLAITEKNVFGSGQTVSVNGDLNSKSRDYSLSLYNPRIFDSLYSFNASIFDTYFEGISYDSKRRGFTVGVGRHLTRYLSANITYGYTKEKLSNYDENLTYIKADTTKSYVVTSLSYDDTDNYFFPTQGKKGSISLEYAGLGGDQKFIKTIAQGKYFYPITNKTYKTIAVLKLRAKAGVIEDNGYLPISEKFYLGGPSSVRGFSSYSISPKDTDGNEIGGKYEFVGGPEISTPINIKNKMWLSGFIDYGAVGENSLSITRSSYGVEFDWVTPMGPLSFIWASPIKSEPEDDTQKFQFNIGTSF